MWYDGNESNKYSVLNMRKTLIRSQVQRTVSLTEINVNSLLKF